jgi:hypothetical protein
MRAQILLALALCAEASNPLDRKINMKIEEGNEMDEDVPQQLQLHMSEEAKKALHLEPNAFTLAKISKFEQSASFGSCKTCFKERQADLATAGAHGKTIWIHSLGRSGASSVYELFMQAMDETKLFSIFEPCASKDTYEGKEIGSNTQQKCGKFMNDVQGCNFDNIDRIVHWDAGISKHRAPKYGKMTAAVECENAELRVFKSMNVQDVEQIKNNLNMHDESFVVSLVRDPRAIWASQSAASQAGVFDSVLEPEQLCETMTKNMKLVHKHSVRVKFEDLVRRPQATARKMYEDAGLVYGDKQTEWVKNHFGLHTDCDETMLSTCKKDSSLSLTKYKTRMSAEVEAKFKSPVCQKLLEKLGYDDQSLAASLHRKK